jgi:pullulanase/glycogen debranching enzyme
MDGRMDYLYFSVMDKQYYYRTDAGLDFIGEYGTETKSEERPMMQRWIIDQCKNLVDQYGIDGFRIDLAGQTDEQTLRKLKRALGPDIIVYGEPWIASADPNYEANPDWDWYKEDAPITFFQDESRNAFKGPPSNPQDKWKDRGYAGGNGDREAVKKALSAGFDTDKTPLSGINYLDIHDNWALADRFAVSDWDGRQGVHENRVKIAATLLFTSLGPVVMHGGTEFLRSKGHAPLVELTKKFQDGYIYIHGKRDTYNLAIANAFIWENKGKQTGDDDGRIKCDYKNMYQFWRGLIRMRKSETGRIFRLSEKPEAGYYRWFEPENRRLLGYLVKEEMLVLINTDSTAGEFKDVQLPAGNWQKIANADRIDHVNGISEGDDSLLEGGTAHTIRLAPESLGIWQRKR